MPPKRYTTLLSSLHKCSMCDNPLKEGDYITMHGDNICLSGDHFKKPQKAEFKYVVIQRDESGDTIEIFNTEEDAKSFIKELE